MGPKVVPQPPVGGCTPSMSFASLTKASTADRRADFGMSNCALKPSATFLWWNAICKGCICSTTHSPVAQGVALAVLDGSAGLLH